MNKLDVKNAIIESLIDVGVDIRPETFGNEESSDQLNCFVGLLKKRLEL